MTKAQLELQLDQYERLDAIKQGIFRLLDTLFKYEPKSKKLPLKKETLLFMASEEELPKHEGMELIVSRQVGLQSYIIRFENNQLLVSKL